jgi:hypothetical protein
VVDIDTSYYACGLTIKCVFSVECKEHVYIYTPTLPFLFCPSQYLVLDNIRMSTALTSSDMELCTKWLGMIITNLNSMQVFNAIIRDVLLVLMMFLVTRVFLRDSSLLDG